MATKTYSLNEFEKIGRSNYTLPESVLNSVRLLCSLVGYAETTTNTYINQHNANVSAPVSQQKKPKEREVRERTYKKPKEDEWKRPVFKATVFAEVDNTQANINEIRVGLNKIKESNCDESVAMFIEKIDEIRDSVDFGDDCAITEKMQQVFETIYTVCISNKMFSKIYATVVTKICKKYSDDLNELLDAKVAEYLRSMQNIVDVNSNDDYDAFCEFTAKNNSRKNITNLICEIAKTGEYENMQTSSIMRHTSDLLTHITECIESADKQKEVEEITENIVIIFSHFGNELKERYKSVFEELASSKKPGLTSRTRFKYMDMIGK